MRRSGIIHLVPLTSENLTAWLRNLSMRNVQVSLPKSRGESEFSLAKALSIMGMPPAFHGQRRLFWNHLEGLAISDVFHKAFVDVAEGELRSLRRLELECTPPQ